MDRLKKDIKNETRAISFQWNKKNLDRSGILWLILIERKDIVVSDKIKKEVQKLCKFFLQG
ncbi:hypothetical protein BCY86_03865 [Pajaroellobacter abortibovis]|uniref:Uncharacterized protein n=1 Tax=Pajaroellobacter abortibovis TaxID=1882918 RepID=A0A1L6MWJ7_9BACT|nr:hypothetical protein BCY86_03865 [Pajaroellobacter abortibovis]